MQAMKNPVVSGLKFFFKDGLTVARKLMIWRGGIFRRRFVPEGKDIGEKPSFSLVRLPRNSH